jgi:hypothetical protein
MPIDYFQVSQEKQLDLSRIFSIQTIAMRYKMHCFLHRTYNNIKAAEKK